MIIIIFLETDHKGDDAEDLETNVDDDYLPPTEIAAPLFAEEKETAASPIQSVLEEYSPEDLVQDTTSFLAAEDIPNNTSVPEGKYTAFYFSL